MRGRAFRGPAFLLEAIGIMTTIQRRLAEPFQHEGGPVAVLLLHGFAGSPAEVLPLGRYLAGQGLTVSAPLLPGHGTHPDELRRTHWPQWVRAAEAELANLQERYGSVHVVGFSMGGALALYLAAHRNLASVTTLAAPAKLADWRQIFVPLAKYFVKDYPTRVSRPEVAAELDSYDRFPVAAIHQLLHLVKKVRKDLYRITAPLMAVQGDRDRQIVADSSEYILANVSSTERVGRILPNRGHMITLEHGRDELFKLVHDWILKHVRQ